MSTSSRRSLLPSRNLDSVKSLDATRRMSRASSRSARRFEVSFDDALSYALRVAFLHYLLQPKQKRRKFVPAPTPKRHSTIGVTEMMNELKGRDSKGFKLPHSFPKDLEKRLTLAISGQERMPGFNEPGIKRSIANAYNSFTDTDFRRTVSKDRKIEQYILVFYSKATAACHAAAPNSDSYKAMVDRHVALFVRLIISVLREHGGHERPELMSSLQSLENKLLTSDQALTLSTSTASNEGTYVEEDVPLTYDVKDMPMVQDVARVFGRTQSDVQTVINENKGAWTEEAALKDLKGYQHRLGAGLPGTLCSRDFDLDDAFAEWKKAEGTSLSQMMLDILKAKPTLAKTNTDNDKPLPLRPTSIYGTEAAYSDLGRAVQSSDASFDGGLGGMGSMSLDEASSIRMVDDTPAGDNAYVFIPSHPREFYKAILQYAMTYDLVHANDSSQEFQPLSWPSREFLMEMSVRWRIPQFTRLVVLLEVAAAKFLDGDMTSVQELGITFDFAKENEPELKKPPHLPQYNMGLLSMDSGRWTIHDFASYRQMLNKLHAALQRELYQVLMETYRTKNSAALWPIVIVLKEHIHGDSAFSQRAEDAEIFAQQCREGLEKAAEEAYETTFSSEVPNDQAQWDFGHVVALGKTVMAVCRTIKKRFAKKPEITSKVDPYRIFVESVLPKFEQDAEELVKGIFEVTDTNGQAIPVNEAFLLYGELNEIRDQHEEVLPDTPFAFDIENLLSKFVMEYLRAAEEKTEEYVDEAIKNDAWQVRAREGREARDDERHSISIIDTFRVFHQTKDGIMNLEWRNAYHLAKFRTTLARIFARGIGRYCEQVEIKFGREMDRSREEEAAAKQQSGFFKLAQDAWTAKEEPEPFQFYSESFVKLNNIEYAMQELDKLEGLLDVEQCVSIIESVEGPVSRNTRTPSKYVFTIKIVEAEDLKACDASGYSDPYVVLCDEFQNRLHRTRVINRNLNPQWNESVDITVSQPLNIIATIWDSDTFGDHDFVGRTSLKLDPRHFGDYLPREFWLDLDTQGRVLIRVSMEGERDDIQFHFGKAFRFLKRSERDMVRKITDKLVARITATISLETLKSLRGGFAASFNSFSSMWGGENKRASTMGPQLSTLEKEAVLDPLLAYFDANFEIMKQTLTDATMIAVMSRLWKEVLLAIESLLIPPLSEKLSTQKQLSQQDLDVVASWKEKLFRFFNFRDEETGEVMGVGEEVLKNGKWCDLGTVFFFYMEGTDMLVRESERMAAVGYARQKAEASGGAAGSRHTAPASLMVPGSGGAGGGFGAGAGGGGSGHPAAIGGAFASMGTIRRGKSITMSRNLGTIRRAKEEKRKDLQAEPSDDVILRILRMRPEAQGYLKDRARQKERMQAISAAAIIVRDSVISGFGGQGGESGHGRAGSRGSLGGGGGGAGGNRNSAGGGSGRNRLSGGAGGGGAWGGGGQQYGRGGVPRR